MTINNNFKSRPERLNFIHSLYFSFSGLDLRFLFIVTGAHYESGLLQLHMNRSMDTNLLVSHNSFRALYYHLQMSTVFETAVERVKSIRSFSGKYTKL